jgi:cyclic-di-GMP phosphodiesterase TipF (flagellum assembly factor)
MSPPQAQGRWASPITANGNHARLAALAEAITAGRVDLLLEPILGLEDHRPRYYTVHVRPRLASGAPIHSDDLNEELRDTGLLPVLDCTRISRIAEVARRLADRGKAGAVFSEFSAESLGHDRFLADFAKAYHERDGLSDQLVLSFAQSDVRAFAPADWATIGDMRDLGFRFALQHVTDLDMDFERVRAYGFDFITLDADVFLNGLPAPGGVVPVADLCRYLAGLGLTLIVEHIDDEAKLARIFGFGALYGQGQLFGGPRLLKAEVARAANAIASAHGHAAA